MMFRSGRCTIDVSTHEILVDGRRSPTEPQVFDLVVLLISNYPRLVTKDEIVDKIWHGRSISDATLSSRIRAARKAIGDDGRSQSMIRTVQRRGFRFVGTVTTDDDHGGRSAPITVSGENPARQPLQIPSDIRQEVRYCRTDDHVRLAYAVTGEGPLLVKAGNWLSHLEYDWESPVWGHVFHRLSQSHTLVRYDARGNGMSDWDVPEFSFDAWVDDLETVVDAARLEQFPLLGISQGCPVSVAYAVRHPERVSHLILYGGRALGAKWRSQEEKELRDAMTVLVRKGWGKDNPAFRQMFTELFIPGASPDQMASFNEMQRNTTSPEYAARFLEVTAGLDITRLLSKVKVPTLVLHTVDDAINSLEAGRQLADGIPGARFVTLPGRNHLFLDDEPAARRFFEELRLFLDE
jgi:pimeloyl-ACP methyl ester carboxylesterase/DNA-binding winged helix-turn-helix (wHTH) protein